ncbi:serine hydrolase domain-containing protein [Tsuneonella mangrovi]|uniref:serine hydrolase domain-containing protein n=1 Tax=Tsuneonella mangrovi TaxID=1982042 RepID=UPI000BA1F251|nr:serine hydrolase domain-containing protein [Tsuneonella mangrovi]
MAFREFEVMQVSRRTLLRTGALAGIGAAAATVPLGRFAFAADLDPWTNVAQLERNYVDKKEVANMVAALGWSQQTPDFLSRGTLAFGASAPAGPDSLYRIYSMTKPITGMAAMQLIDAGKLGLDQPVYDILPAYKSMTVQKTYDGSLTDVEPATRPITIRNLLTHTAGLGYAIIQKGPIRSAYIADGLAAGQLAKLPIPGVSTNIQAPSLKAFADRLAKLPLVYQPGTHWSYSVGLDLLGRVIEVASGQPFDRYLEEHIFEPCGMHSTFFEVPSNDVSRLTTNYLVANGTLIAGDPGTDSVYAEPPPYPMGGSGLVSSARDYDRFLQMLLGYGTIGGRRVMSELAVRVGTSNLLPDGASVKGTWIEGSGFGAGGRVGLGASARTFGWSGAAGTVGFVDFRHRLRANLMTQYMPSNSYPIYSDFHAAVANDLNDTSKT